MENDTSESPNSEDPLMGKEPTNHSRATTRDEPPPRHSRNYPRKINYLYVSQRTDKRTCLTKRTGKTNWTANSGQPPWALSAAWSATNVFFFQNWRTMLPNKKWQPKRRRGVKISLSMRREIPSPPGGSTNPKPAQQVAAPIRRPHPGQVIPTGGSTGSSPRHGHNLDQLRLLLGVACAILHHECLRGMSRVLHTSMIAGHLHSSTQPHT